MLVERVALQAVPEYARIDRAVVELAVSRLLHGKAGFERALNAGFRAMELRQPCVASFIATELTEQEHPRVRELGYFLAVLIFRAFEEAFGPRLAGVGWPDLHRTALHLVADSELRSRVRGQTYSEDAIALGQPALVRRLRGELEHAVGDDPEIGGTALEQFYEKLLVVVWVLTHAVLP
ncbi:MAG: hypothetical protein ABW321_35385 [Polyangiales bacterium]